MHIYVYRYLYLFLYLSQYGVKDIDYILWIKIQYDFLYLHMFF